MNKLHPTQEKLINILKNQRSQDFTIRELQRLLGLSSPAVVFHHLSQLEKKGILRRNKNNPQDYSILDEQPDEPIVYLNVYSTAQCGPKGLLANSSPVDKIPVATRLLGFPSSQAFIVIARGKSMEPKISDGDYVICKKIEDKFNYESYDGKMVLCTNDENCLIKIIYYDKKHRSVVLESLNSIFPPFISSNNFWIEAEVRGVFSYTQ